jgi:nucleotide-binding universal stress UspA family protein
MAGISNGIVAGYDGSPGGEQALQWAVREAQVRRTVLTVCVAWAPADLAMLSEAAVDDLARQRGEEILEHGVEYARSMLGPGVVRPLLARESAAKVLCERSSTAEMIVLGARGRGGVAGLKTGSVAWQVAVHGHGAVVMIRGQRHVADHAPGPVVVGVDGSPASQAAIAFAVGEAVLHAAPLLAVCALSDAPGRLGGAREMQADFSHAMTACERKHPEVIVLQQVEQGSPRAALLDAAPKARLVVVGCRGRGGVPGMNLGSVAQAMLAYAPCPVGVIHPLAGADHDVTVADS